MIHLVFMLQVANINNCFSYASDLIKLVTDNVNQNSASFKELLDIARDVSKLYAETLASKW